MSLGPYAELPFGDSTIPWYLLSFDKKGRLKSPATLDHLVEHLVQVSATDVIVFCHGWNNDWPAARRRYTEFIGKVSALRGRSGAPRGEYRPVLVGIVWPSAAWTLPWERAPRMALAGAPAGISKGLRSFDSSLGASEPEFPGSLAALEGWNAGDRVGEAQAERVARELADLLAVDSLAATGLSPDDQEPVEPARRPPGELGEVLNPIDGEELLAAWRDLQALDSEPEPADEVIRGGFADGAAGVGNPSGAGPRSAGGARGSLLDPRVALRLFTLWQMKDRAAKVGSLGLASAVSSIKEHSSARLHLIGHSFGAKVVLESVARRPLPGDGKVRSVLLLQPAVSAWSFSPSLPEGAGAGGYSALPERTELPILSTFSRRDFALRQVFHLALRRRHDFAEGRLRSASSSVSRWAALGGFGPQGMPGGTVSVLDLPAVGEPLPLSGGASLLALRGGDRIRGHGDISTDYTAWALSLLLDQGRSSEGDGG